MSFISNTEGYYNFKKADEVITRTADIADHEWFYSAELLADVMSHFQEEDLVLAQLAELGGVPGVAFALRTNQTQGIAKDELDKWDEASATRVEYYGRNEIARKPPTPFWQLCLNEMEDFMLRILIFCATVSIIVGAIFEADKGGWLDGLAILAAVVVVVLVGALNNFQKEKQFRSMEAESEQKSTIVLRNNEETEIDFADCVAGDLIVLRAGYAIPCDGLFVFGTDNFKTDEAGLTGESREIPKNRFHPLLMGGTYVSQGDCLMLATAVGEKTQWGALMAGLQEERKPTPLQDRLDRMGQQIGYLGIVVAIILFLILMVRWVIAETGTGWKETGDHNSWTLFFEEIVHAAILSVTIVVVAVPEGLPLAVTISLAYSMKKMLLDNNFVRHLAACETMGNATTICSDKTGTLTTNKMSVNKVHINKKAYMTQLPKGSELGEVTRDVLTKALIINSKAFHEEPHDEATRQAIASGKQEPRLVGGNQTECALLQWAINLGASDYKAIRANNPVTKFYVFDSAVKRSSVFLKNRSKENTYVMYTKGAAEQILAICTKYLGEDGTNIEMTDDARKEIANAMDTMTRSGLRCLGIATKEYTREECPWTADGKTLIEDDAQMFVDMVWVAVTGIKDPVRAEVPDAVATCQKAGIIVRMVTGDHLETAKHIAKECGILTCPEHVCMEGHQFRNMTEAEKAEKLPMLRVLARSKPQDKEQLVRWYMQNGHVVAVTGDGANDALALKEADVGLSMGIQGTHVAKEASDVVIMDDNFASIEKTVMWGRSVYDNIRKFVQFQLTVNVVALTLSLVAAFFEEYQTPLNAVQLLWVNLIMDTMAALALATEQPTRVLLNRLPFDKNAHLLTASLKRFIGGHSAFQLAALCFTMFYGAELIPSLKEGDDTDGNPVQNVKLLTVIFNLFVWLQIFNEINARRVNNEINVFGRIMDNYYFVSIFIFTIGAQILLVQFGGEFIRTKPLNFEQWMYCIGVSAMAIPINQIIRLVKIDLTDGLIDVDLDVVFKKDKQFMEGK